MNSSGRTGALAARFEDSTSRSRGERGAEPREWTLRIAELLIIIHRSIYDPGNWFLSCPEMSIEDHKLKATDADGSKKEALNYVRRKCEMILKELQ